MSDNHFATGANPQTALSIGQLAPDEEERIRKRFESLYSGPGNAHRPIVFSDYDLQFKKLSEPSHCGGKDVNTKS